MVIPSGTVTFLFTDIEGSSRLWEQYPGDMTSALARHDALLRQAIEARRGYVFKTVGDAFCAAFADPAAAVIAALDIQRALGATAAATTDHRPPTTRATTDHRPPTTRATTDHRPPTTRATTDHRPPTTEEGGTADVSVVGGPSSVVGPVVGGPSSVVGPVVGGPSSVVGPVVGGPSSVVLRVRIGLHAGVAEQRDGDYFGPALNRAARLMAAGHGGQTLLSQVVAGLVAERLPDGISLRDLGEHRLRDLSRPERIYQLVTSDLPSDFPPLHSLDTLTTNLPTQLTSFVGRERQVADVEALLADGRLVTILGPGGAGKTRLSLQVAAERLDAYPDGVWFVDLAPVSDASLVPQTIATALDVRPEPGRPVQAALLDYLRAKRALIVLDNCEQLVAACAEVSDAALRACPHLSLLATSREALAVPGEAEYRLSMLVTPAATDEVALDALRRCEAVRLFVDRAAAAAPGFALNERNAAAVAAICRRLDGLPLALELAAARVKSLPVEQIARRLDDRFRLLTGGSRGALPHHQTLRALIDWSHDLLTEDERIVFRRLAVFAGGWSLDAAEAVVAGDGVEADDVLDLLARLLDKSLIVMDDADGEARYHWLETLREYAVGRLAESGETEALRARHLAYFRAFVADVAPLLRGPQRMSATRRLEADNDNLRAALAWAVDHNPDVALEMVGGLGEFWAAQVYAHEGWDWTQKALARDVAEATTGEISEQRRAARIVALIRGGQLASMLALPKGRTLLRDAITQARGAHDARLLCDALSQYALWTAFEGNFEESLAAAREAASLARETGDIWLLARALLIEAQPTKFTGDFAAAHAMTEEAIRAGRQAGDLFLIAMGRWGLALNARLAGDDASAERHFRESLTLFEQIGARSSALMARSELAHIARRRGDLETALGLYRETLPAWQEMNRPPAIAHQIESLAYIAHAQGRPERAARLLAAAEALRRQPPMPPLPDEAAEYDRELAAVRETLTPAAFDAAWEAGASMTQDEAVAYALAETDEA